MLSEKIGRFIDLLLEKDEWGDVSKQAQDNLHHHEPANTLNNLGVSYIPNITGVAMNKREVNTHQAKQPPSQLYLFAKLLGGAQALLIDSLGIQNSYQMFFAVYKWYPSKTFGILFYEVGIL